MIQCILNTKPKVNSRPKPKPEANCYLRFRIGMEYSGYWNTGEFINISRVWKYTCRKTFYTLLKTKLHSKHLGNSHPFYPTFATETMYINTHRKNQNIYNVFLLIYLDTYWESFKKQRKQNKKII